MGRKDSFVDEGNPGVILWRISCRGRGSPSYTVVVRQRLPRIPEGLDRLKGRRGFAISCGMRIKSRYSEGECMGFPRREFIIFSTRELKNCTVSEAVMAAF